MALVDKLEQQNLEKESKHSKVDCTYALVRNSDGQKFLQIDTYGSSKRQIKGKKSQSIRFSQNAINELKNIIKDFESFEN